GLEVGICLPGTEGELTYSSGGLPLLQLREWRRRFAPARDGLLHEYEVDVLAGTSDDVLAHRRRVWREAWEAFRPSVEPIDVAALIEDCSAVLADQVTT